MDVVELKNGTIEAEATVKAVSLSVRHLLAEKPIVFYELVMKCKDRDHKLFGDAEKDLEALSLIQNGVIHESIKNVVLFSVEGEGFDMTLVDPIKQ